MSHTKIRKFWLDEKGNPKFEGCENNIIPYHWYESGFIGSEDCRENMKKFCVNMLEGSIQPYKNIKPYKVLAKLEELIKKYCPDVDFHQDLRLKVNRTYEVYDLISENLGVPLLYEEKPDENAVIKLLEEFNAETVKAYKDKNKEYSDADVVIVDAAILMDIKGFDVLCRHEGNECIICKNENYGSNGLLNNADKSAVFLGENTTDLFYSLNRAKTPEEAVKILKNNGIKPEKITEALSLLTGEPYEFRMDPDEDLTGIKDSMQIDSGTVIATLKTGNSYLSLEVRGEVKVWFNPDKEGKPEDGEYYRYPSEFPQELKDLIAENRDWDLDSRVYVSENNWFELFKSKDEKDPVPESATVDAEGSTPAEILMMLLEYAWE